MVDGINVTENRLVGLFAFVGIVLISHSDRLGIYILYRYFLIKVHHWILRCIVGVGTFIGGLICLSLFVLEPKSPFVEMIFRVVICLFAVGVLRWAVVKGNYFFLDDNFYKDKNGFDIRNYFK